MSLKCVLPFSLLIVVRKLTSSKHKSNYIQNKHVHESLIQLHRNSTISFHTFEVSLKAHTYDTDFMAYITVTLCLFQIRGPQLYVYVWLQQGK